MFLRCKVLRKDGKQHRYWSIVENTRTARGRVVQHHVLYLGEINSTQELAWRRSIEVMEAGTAQPRTLSLFPEDRCDGLVPVGSIVRLKLSVPIDCERIARTPCSINPGADRQAICETWLPKGGNMRLAFDGRATRNFLLLLCMMEFVLFIDRVNLAAAAPVMQKDLGLSNLALGFAFSAFNYSYAPFQLVGGWFADRFGARRTLTVCGVVWSITTIVTGIVRGLGSLFAVRLVLGMGEGATLPAATRALSNWTSLAARGTAVGLTHSAGRLGAGAAAPIVALLISWFSWRISFVVLGGLSALWAAAWWWYFQEDPRQHPSISSAELAALSAADPKRQIAYGPVPWRRLVPRMTPMMIGYFCQGWTGWLYVTWMPSLLSKNYGLELKKSSLFYAGTLLCAMIAELLGGIVTDHLLRRTGSLLIARSLLIATSWVLAVASLLPAILVHDLLIGMAGFTLALFFLGFAISPIWTATIDIAPAYAGSASALMNAAGAVAGIISPVAFGWILQRTGSWTTPFTVSLGLLLFGAIVTFWFRPDRPLDTAMGIGGLAVAGD